MNKTKFFSSLLVAALFATTSVFTSCKDYDDDIKSLQEQIDKNSSSMKSELESLKSSLQAEKQNVEQSLATKTAALQQAIDKINSELGNKASAADLTALTNTVNAQATSIAQLISSIDGLTAKDAALQTSIDAINTALADYAKNSDLEALAAKYTALKGDFDKAVEEFTAKVGAVEATAQANSIAIAGVQENLTLQQQAFEAYKAEMAQKLATMEEQLQALHAVDVTALNNSIATINGEIETIKTTFTEKAAELTQKIEAVDAKLADYAKLDDLNALKQELKAELTELSTEINKVQAQVNMINAFIDKQLTSLVLMPTFYWEGLEAIEAPALLANVFAPIENDYEFYFKVTGSDGTLGEDSIKVVVDETMGFVGTDGNTYCSETKLTWIDARTNPGKVVNTEYEVWSDQSGYQDSVLLGQSLKPVDGAWVIYKAGAYPNYVPATVSINNGALGIWHYNPATADLRGWDVNFFGNLAAHYTRAGLNDFLNANQYIGATPKSSKLTGDEDDANLFMNGILAVPFDVNWDNVMGMFYDWAYLTYPAVPTGYGRFNSDPEWSSLSGYGTSYDDSFGKFTANLPFIALQLEKGDTTVTSDYAVIVPAELSIVALADNDPEEKIGGRSTKFSKTHNPEYISNNYPYDDEQYYGTVRGNHLYESVGYAECNDSDSFGAIPMPATHSVKYDGQIDLTKFIETHYDYTSYAKYGTSVKDQVMSEELMAQLGLHYEFKAIDYYLGNEATSESAHIEEIEEGVFAPRSVTADGQTIKGQTATREVIDREPLIRVDLVDNEDNIVRYGYIKLRIVEEEQSKSDVYATFEFDDIYMNCGDSVKVTWSQMENQILAQLNMKKQEFEQNYYLEVVGKRDYMPHLNPATGEVSGALYADAEKYQFMAVRYAKAGDKEATKGSDGLDNLEDYTNTANWFGRVWYTPHDNATSAHNWDSQTNVLIWNICDSMPGNMTRAGYEKMMSVLGVTYKSKGLSTKDLSTVVRFVNKNTGTSVWVTLKIPAGKVHFAYSDIHNRDLAHWYDVRNGYARETEDTIEVYANVPAPDTNGQGATTSLLTFNSFDKDVKQYWKKYNGVTKVVPIIYDAANFKEFTKDDNLSVTFKFRLPNKGNNTLEQYDTKDGKNTVNETVSGNTWNVKGISGAEYTLKIAAGADKDAIVASLRNGVALNDTICTLTKEGQIHYMGRTEGIYAHEKDSTGNDANLAACDILNYIGRYDPKGNDITDDYLSTQDDKTFTAYVEIKVHSKNCYDPKIGKNYFNVRFLRPINVWPGNESMIDAQNATQFVDIWRLLYMRDWRKYAIVMDGETQKFGDKAYNGTGLDGKSYKGDYKEGEVPYSYYGISNLWVERDQIRTDHDKTESVRKNILTDKADIEKLTKVTDLPSMTRDDGVEFIKIVTKAQKDAFINSGTPTPTIGKANSDDKTDVIAYSNNSGVVQEFHFYVPISVEYPWGAVTDWTQKTWAVITVKPTTGN